MDDRARRREPNRALERPLGGGKRAIVGELCRSAIADTEDDVAWRVNVREEDEGMAVALRAYAALFKPSTGARPSAARSRWP